MSVVKSKRSKRINYRAKADATITRLLYGAKSRAKARNIPFDLTARDVELPSFCPVLGIPLELGRGEQVDGSPTLDRIIPERGYVRGNVIVISWRANRLKSNATIEELSLISDFFTHLQKEKATLVDGFNLNAFLAGRQRLNSKSL